MTATETVAGIDLAQLATWLDEHSVSGGPISDVTPLTGGTQNILLRFSRGGRQYVLRRPPLNPREGSDDAIRREARVLRALTDTGIPHPRLVAATTESGPFDFAVTVTEFVAGTNPAESLAPGYQDPEWQRRIGLSIADAAAAVGVLDPESHGLAGLGRPQGFLDRQAARWQRQLDSYQEMPGYPGPDLPGIQEIACWLEGNRPDEARPGLMHGDFHIANILVAEDRPEVAAVVDWELSTVGDPLLDLGWLLATWPDRSGVTPSGRQIAPFEGFPTGDDLVHRYAERSDRDLSAISWYEVLACYKLGIILEGTYARACAGRADRQVGDWLHRSTLALVDRGLRRIASPRASG